MAISPFYVGQTNPPLSLSFKDDSGSAINLTSVTLSLLIRNTQWQTPDIVGGGSFTITNAAAGLATYQWVTADTQLASDYFQLLFKAVNGSAVTYFDPVPFQIKPI